MVMDSYIDNNENNNNVINHKNETNQIIYDLIKQNKNEKLKKFLRNNNNRNEIIIDNNLYKIAIKSNNFNSFELLNEYDTKENFKFLIENNPFILNYIFQNEVTLSKVTEQIASLYDYKKTCPKKKFKIPWKDLLYHCFSGVDLDYCYYYSDEELNEIKLLMKYLNQYNISLNLNEKDQNGNYPLLLACQKENIEVVNLLFDYSNKNNIVLEMNEKIKRKFSLLACLSIGCDNGDYPLLNAIKNWEGDYPFLCACWGCFKESVKLIRLLMDYADKNNFILRINDKNENGDYPILSISMSYSDGYYIGNINSKNFYEDNSNETFCYPLLYSIGDNETETVKLIFDHANKNNIILDINNNGTIWYIFININEKGKDNQSLLLFTINTNNTELVKLLIDYADKMKIILEINEKDKEGNNIFLSTAIQHNNNKLFNYSRIMPTKK
ncbi:hypothetical protein BCR32DRAFT_288103 [Anaeromyces robustus]|uniref:Uncharacterized protein n=1 Tax=Anaeromyces robustus TaxID=1754192 RepID=A0A1Y1VDR5_9FUNG|nr:hypothetical protein BCR32DRAFT_288103 [Anaeromyces robustus]|eukprot:ORX53697.1 hypothetical protein BCR32DRAFT_288103 [Anaeromyces robustus]